MMALALTISQKIIKFELKLIIKIAYREQLMEYRKIIHIDMDAFFASVEQRDNPELKGKPVAVGHSEGRGVVAAASYEARVYGVRSAMPSSRAKKLCPQLIFVDGNFAKYKEVSRQMHDIFHEYTDLVEPISLDEAFLDVTHNKPGIDIAVVIAREIKKKIRERLNLIASAGVSYNKFLAKVASDFRKPDGLCTIHPSVAPQFIKSLPIEAFWGVGPVTASKMHEMGIHNGEDLRSVPEEKLRKVFGKAGTLYHLFSLGIDDRPVESIRIRKSVGCEMTLEEDVSERENVESIFNSLANDLISRLEKSGFKGHTFTLKIKHANFTQKTRSVSTSDTRWPRKRIIETAYSILDNIDIRNNPVRLFGFSISNPSGNEKESVSQVTIDESEITAINAMGKWHQLKIDFEKGY